MGALQSGVPQGTKPSNRSGQIRGVTFNTKVCQSLNISKWLLFCWVGAGRLIARAGLRLPQYLRLALNSCPPASTTQMLGLQACATPFSDYCFKNLSCF